MSNDVSINVKTNDQASAGLGKIADNTESMTSRAGKAIDGLGQRIGGELGDVVSKVGEGIEKFGDQGMAMGTKLAITGGVIAGLGVALSAIGSSDKAAEQQLSASVSAVGESVSDYSKQIDAAESKGEDFGHSAADVDNALNTLVTKTGDVSKAVTYMGLVEDLAAAKHESLAAASTQVGQALDGNTKLFRQYGITVTAGTQSTAQLDSEIEQLDQRLNGQAAAATDTFTGRLDALRAHATDMAATFGNNVAPALTIVGTVMGIAGSAVDIFSARSARATAAQIEKAAADTAEAGTASAAAVSTLELSAADTALAGSATKASVAQAGLGSKLALGVPLIGSVVEGINLQAKGSSTATDITKKHGSALGGLFQAANLVTGGGAELGSELFGLTQKHTSAAQAAQNQAAATDALDTSLGLTAAQVAALVAPLDISNKAFAEGETALSDYTAKLKAAQPTALQTKQTTYQFEDSVAALSTQLTKNGQSFTDNSADHRANAESLLGLIDNINTMSQASVDAGDSASVTATKTTGWNNELLALAGKSKGAATEIQGMINTYEQNPKTFAYQMVLNTQSVLDSLTGVDEQLAYLGGLEKTDIAAYDQIKGSFNQFVTGAIKGAYATGGIATAATGGNRGGSVTWAEQGAEVAQFPNGTHIWSNADSQSKFGGSSSAQGVTLMVQSSGNPVDDFIVEVMRRAVRIKGGGNVQRTLGQN